ncbi:MAG: hypothetical protein JKY65_14170, partial [Planctomycetes bacterium]|nr:hypothetical protein [Planctomycetota bacterium]
GYVVAARLGAATDAGQKVVGGHLGFVLLRHELKQLSEPDAEGDGGGEEEDRHVLYSLYMHLAPLTPDELAAGQGPPWLERLLAQSNGQVVGAGSSALAPGEVRWASAPLEGPDLSGEVEVRGPGGTAALDLGQPVPDEGRPVMAVLKPAPADLDQAKQAFAQGHVATFDRPLIPIAGGEVIGTVSPYPGIDPEELETGFLHWEVFAPEGAGISKVLELAKELVGEESLGGEIALGESEEEQANLLKAETLGELLKPLLPDDEQQAADHEEGFLSRWHYEPILRELFNHPSVLSFANSANDDVEWEDWAAPDPLSVEDASERVAAKLATPSETGAQTGADPEAGAETGAETGAPLAPHPYDGDLTYPLTLQVENFAPESWKPSAAEPFHLEVSFKPDWLRQRGALALDSSAEEWTFTIQVPAAATKIVLEPRDGSFRIDTIIDLPEPLEVQKKALTALLPRRWRGVKLTRTPEYALETVKATVAPRFNDIDALAPYLEPIAWWNSGKEGEDARPREVAVLGAEGQETSLFTAEGLPPEGKLDFLNPIAGLWLLNTLVVGGRAAFVGPDELAKVDADGGAGKLLDWGLIPPSGVSLEAASVGQLVHALVVTDDYASGREVVLEAKPSGGGDSAELGTFLTRAGVVSVPLALSGWGKWTLEIKGEQGQSRAALPLEVTIATPTLGAVADPKRKPKQSVYSWILPFSSHAPGELQVWIGLRTAAIEIGSDAPPASWEEQALRIPALATLLPEEPSEDARGIKWSSGGDLVLGARRGKGDVSLPSAGYKTNRFKVSEFFNATVGASQVSLRAIQLLNTIRLAYKKSLRIVAVEDEGWKILSGDSSARNSETAYQKLLKVGKEVLTELQSGPESAAWENCQVEGDPNRKSIAISATPPPRTAGGSLELLFDPSLALAELVETKGESIQPGHCLGVSFGLVAPQSGWGDPTLADEEKIGEIVFPAKASEAGNDEAIVAWTPDPIAHLVNVSFGALSATVHGDWLTLSAPLQGGTLPDWRRAKPRIALGGTVLKSAIVATDASQTGSAGAETGAVGEVSAKIKLSKIGGQATFSAKTLISPATFHGVETTVGAPELSLDSTPRLEEAEVLPHDKDPGRVVVRCKAPYLPAGKGLKLKVSKAGAEIKELGLAATFHVANKGTGGALKGSGCRDDDWDVIAQLTLEELRDHFEDGETIDFEFYRPSGWEEPTLSPITASTPMPAEPRIQEEAKMQPLEN